MEAHGPRHYPWGEEWDSRAVCSLRSGGRPSEATVPVDTLPGGDGPFGHRHLAGNVWEWLAEGGAGEERALAGGGWASGIEDVGGAARLRDGSGSGDFDRGFRLHREA